MPDDIIKPMRIFTYGDTYPDIPQQTEQVPLVLKAASTEEMLANKDKFPLIDNFELVLFDGRQNPPEKSLGSDIMAHFVNGATNQRITHWDMYYVDTKPMDTTQVPIPAKGKALDEIEMGYHISITADDEFVYIAHNEDDEETPTYTRYFKVPKNRYESEWKAFIDWYHEHPEKRHPHPTPAERMAHSDRNPDGSLKKRGNWLSKLFK